MAGWKGCECLKVKKCKTWEGYFNLSGWIYFIKIINLNFINFRVIEVYIILILRLVKLIKNSSKSKHLY